jgi:hypothetical protein
VANLLDDATLRWFHEEIKPSVSLPPVASPGRAPEGAQADVPAQQHEQAHGSPLMTYAAFLNQFFERFRRNEDDQRQLISDLWRKKQTYNQPTEESVDNNRIAIIIGLRRRSAPANIPLATLVDVIVNGLRSDIKIIVSQHQPSEVNDIY